MKKLLVLLCAALLFGSTQFLKAQCFGTVAFDVSANANGASTFNLTTANSNEMILISVDGWDATSSADLGPITVDGNNATLINTAVNGNSGIAEVWAYVAPAAGLHSIVVTETNFQAPYTINFAAAFYVTGSCTPLSLSNLTSVETTVLDSTSGNITGTISTTAPNSMIYCNSEYNEVAPISYPISWTNATFLDDLHVGNGIEASDAYAAEPAIGTYSIKATNSAPLTAQGGLTLILVDITPPACGVTVTAAVGTSPTCGSNNGTATTTVTGGTTPYTYSWAPSGGTNATAIGLSAGTYTVTVTDNLGCTGTASVTLTSTSSVTTTVSSANVLCNGGNTGTATVTPSGGTTPYTYLWNPSGKTTQTATGLSAGNYTITVIDNSGCTATNTVTISQPLLLNATTSSITATCGQNNGSVTVSVTGGTSPYTYLWNPGGGTTATVSNLSAGTYTVTVFDVNGCNVNAAVTVANSSGINTSISASTNVLCNGFSTGSATVTATGGTTPYTYSWAPSGGTNATATGLSAGTYTVTVTDNNGCSTPAIAIITQPKLVRDSISSIIYPLCNGGTGTATVGVTGGVSPYAYSWAPSGGTNATASGLTAGSYTITITDNNGCLSTVTVTITQPIPITGTYTTTPTTCGNNNGTITATIGGGTSPYTYLWNPGGQTNSTATGLSIGTYTLTVTDNNGCTRTGTATVRALTSPTVTVTSSINDKCNGNSNGSATVSVSGGTSPYTYSWAPGGSTTATESNLSAGTYTITVHDSSGCVTTTTVIITQPAPINVTATSTGVLCNGGSTGTATTTASGGTTPYTYLWNPSGQTNVTATGLSAGVYTVNVTDNNGCRSSTTATVTQPTVLKDTITSISYPLCNGGTGSATVGVSGGTPSYTYLWTPGGGTNATQTGLIVGTYTVTIKDNNGCTGANVIITITQPAAITLTTHINPTPCGDSLGLAWVDVRGGTGPYTYLWNPTGQTQDSALNLSAGTYTVTVTDKNGCTQTATATVTTTTSIILSSSAVKGVLCNGGSTGSATVNASGGQSPYTYQWAPGGGTNATESGLSAGTYTVTVTDNKGCNNTISVTITQPNPLVAVPVVNNITCNGLNNGSASVSPSGGTAPYTYVWAPMGNTASSVSGLSVGTYTLAVIDANGCSVTSAFTITQPTALTASLTSTDASCAGNNGTATVTAGGGTAPYTYSWNPSAQTNATATGLSAGIYTVTVTDHNGCTETDTITVHNSSTLSITTTNTNLLCNGASTATATVTATAGTAPYTYSWAPGGKTNATATGLSAGTYTITVTDNAGCNQFAVVTITQPSAIIPTTSSTSAGCTNNTGTATVSASGGTGAYTYSWAPGGATTSTISGLGSGSYTITVTDANGCSATAITNVASGGVSGSITATTNVTCFGSNTGSATVTAVGNATPFTYSWAPGGQTNATATGLSEGSYTVTVTDNNGCSFTTSVTITGPASAIATTGSVTNASCNSSNNGAIALNVSGGTPPYTFTWSNSSTTQNISNILPGTYTVIIKDSNGCSLVDSFTVSFDSSVFAHAGNDTVICHNSTVELNGSGSVNATGYAWYQMPGFILIKDTSVVFVTPTNDTTTYVLVVTHGTCTDTSSVTIVTLPALFINPGPDQIIYGTGTVTLGGTPTNPSGTSVVWEPNSTLNDSLFANPAATPTVTTVYTVMVSNAGGCKASDTVTVFILPGINPPSGFTPNGDGTNDYWVLPFAGDFPNIEVEVYNRWGELLFQSNGYNTPWDGQYSGKPVPIGTYYFIINLNDSRFPKALTGSVTIMR